MNFCFVIVLSHCADCCCVLVTGRLYRTVLCRCYDNRRQGRGVPGDGAVTTNAPQNMNVATMPSTTNRDNRLVADVDDDDDDEDVDAATLPRLRFEITFHRPCGSLRRRQRRQDAVEQGTTPHAGRRRRTEAGPCETIELDMTQCATSVAVG